MPLSTAETALSTQAQAAISAAQNGTENNDLPTVANPPSTSPGAARAVLNYPLDLLDTIQEFFQITAINYSPPNADQLRGRGQGTGGGVLSGGLGSAYASITQQTLRNKRNSNDLGTVILPMPSQINDVNGSNWGDTYMNPLTATAIGAVGDVGNAAANPFSIDITKLGDPFKDAAKGLTSQEFAEYGKTLVTQKMISQVNLNVDENELLARATGRITNPNAELLYKGPRLRQFSFTYQLTPRSRAEATRIRQIIRFFKQNMSAKKSTFLLSTPNVFFLEYRRKGRGENNRTEFKSLNKFKPCALVDFKVDNSARGQFWNSYYDDGNYDESQPITTGISFSFQEIVPIFNEDYNEFPENDNVGY